MIEFMKALEFSMNAHAGQKYGNEPYFMHPLRVAMKFTDPTEQTVALLHDTVEDTSVTVEEIESEYGAVVASAVEAMSRRKDEVYATDYLPRLAKNQLARKVKIADLEENIFQSEKSPDRKKNLLTRYYAALKYLKNYQD